MRRVRSYRLTEEATAILERYAGKWGVNRTAALEILIRSAKSQVDGDDLPHVADPSSRSVEGVTAPGAP